MTSHRTPPARVLSLLAVCCGALLALAQDEAPLTRLFDTGSSSAEPLSEEALAQRTKWHLVPEDTIQHPFSGDAIFLNDKLAVVLRKQGRGAEVYARGTGRLRPRATLGLAETLTAPADLLGAIKIVENSSSAVMIEATFAGKTPAALRFRLTTGEAILETSSEADAGFVNALSKTRQVVVPDYFGDDMVFGPESWRGLCLPAENFSLSLLEGGDALLMSVWQSREQEAWLVAPDSAKEAGLCAQRIRCQKGKSIWFAFLEAPGLWRAGGVVAKDEWKPPFPARWRGSYVRAHGVADSWDVETGPSPAQAAGQHEGPLVIYPLDRTATTPLTATCPTDVMRNTLGVGPCQYILACEGMGAQGDPTPNSVMNWVEKQFAQKKEVKTAEDIRQRLEFMTQHVGEARTRIERYAQFAGQIRQVLADKPGTEPYRLILTDLDRFTAAGLAPAAAPERAKQWASEVDALIGKANSLASCQRLGEQLRALGTIQDGTLARSRMAVRRLRQEGRTLAAAGSGPTDLAQQIERLVEQLLQKK